MLLERYPEYQSLFEEQLNHLKAKRPLFFSDVRLMAVVNMTPDSFSDGGRLVENSKLYDHLDKIVNDGATIVDIGGESTRPGATTITTDEELKRVQPCIEYLTSKYPEVKFSIDTRKSDVARYALEMGAFMFNDVSALTFDNQSIEVARKYGSYVCLMHAQGTPETMQQSPQYSNVVLDVYEWLKDRIEYVVQNGLSREKIIVDPGIGFGKTTTHNLLLLKNISLFHSLGCPILLGTSRKRFVGEITQEEIPENRVIGSIATVLYSLPQCVQILRVHDVKETRQAIQMWQACQSGKSHFEG
jgi:dihydropteroate synthase